MDRLDLKSRSLHTTNNNKYEIQQADEIEDDGEDEVEGSDDESQRSTRSRGKGPARTKKNAAAKGSAATAKNKIKSKEVLFEHIIVYNNRQYISMTGITIRVSSKQ